MVCHNDDVCVLAANSRCGHKHSFFWRRGPMSVIFGVEPDKVLGAHPLGSREVTNKTGRRLRDGQPMLSSRDRLIRVLLQGVNEPQSGQNPPYGTSSGWWVILP